MKKIVSLFLAVVICLSCVSVFGLEVYPIGSIGSGGDTNSSVGDIVDTDITEGGSVNSGISEPSEDTNCIELITFQDIPESHWAYDAIMSMSAIGLFTGVTMPVNGVGTFAPNGTMTRAQFITVLTRNYWPDAVEAVANDTAKFWYEPNYMVAVEKGVLTVTDFNGLEGLNAPITRQEMAYLITNVLKINGELPETMIDESRVADLNTVGAFYRSSVLSAYTAGIIMGVDTEGTFAPLSPVTRAQGAVILYRLINPEARQVVEIPTND